MVDSVATLDPFHTLLPSALRRIASFVEFNPEIPTTSFSVDKESLRKVSWQRQEEWLHLHREELSAAFAEAGTPTSVMLLQRAWSYDRILSELLKNSIPTNSFRSLRDKEWFFIRSLWQTLPDRLTRQQWLRVWHEVKSTLCLSHEVKEFHLVLENHDNDKAKAIHICRVMLSQIKNGSFGLENLFYAPSISTGANDTFSWLLGTITRAVTETIDSGWKLVEQPKEKKMIPAVLEIILDRFYQEQLREAPKSRPVSKSDTKPVESPSDVQQAASQPHSERALLQYDFNEKSVALEGLLKKKYLNANYWGADTRTLGDLIRDIEGQHAQPDWVFRDLRSVKKVRNALFHHTGEHVTDEKLKDVVVKADRLILHFRSSTSDQNSILSGTGGTRSGQSF